MLKKITDFLDRGHAYLVQRGVNVEEIKESHKQLDSALMRHIISLQSRGSIGLQAGAYSWGDKNSEKTEV